MKACKGFDKNLRSRGFQYEVGGEYTEETAELCNCGPHACENPLDTLRYYRPGDSRYCEVEIEDNGQRSSYDSKVCGKHIKIGAEIGLKGVINAGVRFVMERCEDATEKYASGVRGNAAALCEQMRVLYAHGKSDAEIGREIGRSKSTVRRWQQKSCLPAQEHEAAT